jgi:hypothetical protein
LYSNRSDLVLDFCFSGLGPTFTESTETEEF